MPPSQKTLLLCLDDHRNFSEDIKKKFSDEERYAVMSYQDVEEFRLQFGKAHDSNICRIAIIVINDNGEMVTMAEDLAAVIKEYDKSSGVILVYNTDKSDEIKGLVNFADACIPRNNNSVLRLHNAVKKIISEHTIDLIRKRRNRSLYLLLIFVAISVVAVVCAYFIYPEYF